MNNNALIKITVIIPSYNEGVSIIKTIELLETILVDSNFGYEIIVVNDGSVDKTVELLSECKSNFILINHEYNQGYGASLKTGIRNSSNEILCITDADGTYPHEKIPSLVTNLLENDLDMVIGARTGKNVQIPVIRKPAKWFLSKLANWITGEKIPDINSGLRVFKKSSFIPFQFIVPNGFSFTTTITLGMLLGGFEVKFMPIDYLQRLGKSKIRPIRDTLNFIKIILKLGLYFAPLKILMPISIGIFLFALGCGVFTKVVYGELADVSTLIIAMTGFQVAIIALIAELINHRLPNKYIK